MSQKMKRQSVKYKGIGYAIMIITVLMSLLVIFCGALILKQMYDEKYASKEAVADEIVEEEPIGYTQEQVDDMLAKKEVEVRAEAENSILNKVKQAFLGSNTAVEALRPLFPDDIVVVSNGAFYFEPINRSLKMHQLVQDNLKIDEDGVLSYYNDSGEECISHKGIDVSKFQGKINWKKVKEDGVEYAFIRVGLRGYGSGEIVEDATFKTNIEGAIKAGVKVGVYFFSQAITVDEAVEEAQFVLEQIADYDVTYPVVFDVEKVADKNGRMNLITPEERTDNTIAFCDTIKEAGYTPMIYANTEMYTVLLEYERLEAYEKWYAFYDSKLYFPYDFKVWQYSEKGKVNGINEPVDLNISFKTWGEE